MTQADKLRATLMDARREVTSAVMRLEGLERRVIEHGDDGRLERATRDAQRIAASSRQLKFAVDQFARVGGAAAD